MNSLIIHFTLMIFQVLTLCTIFKRQQGNVQQGDNFIRLPLLYVKGPAEPARPAATSSRAAGACARRALTLDDHLASRSRLVPYSTAYATTLLSYFAHPPRPVSFSLAQSLLPSTSIHKSINYIDLIFAHANTIERHSSDSITQIAAQASPPTQSGSFCTVSVPGASPGPSPTLGVRGDVCAHTSPR